MHALGLLGASEGGGVSEPLFKNVGGTKGYL